MNTRRQFLISAPLGVLGVIAACNEGAHAPSGADSVASGGATPVTGSATAPVATPTSVAAIPPDAPTLSWIPQHKDLVYTFGGATPRQHIKSGTRIVTWTEDCFDGAVKTAADLPSKKMAAGHDNPQTGPFYIEGAEPGDTVAIHIVKLEPARAYAVSSFSPGFGALVGNDQTAMLGPDFPETTWRYDLDAKRTVARAASADGKYLWSVPLAPFLGCIGVAPAGGEVRTTIVPGNFGGNMDCPEVRAGNTVYLGVNEPGALLSFGDGHYAMGEGEIMGAAIEGAMNVEVYVELIKSKATPIPRIENADEIIFVGSGRPLEDAARVAFKAMIGWVREKSGMSVMDAYQFVAQNAKAPIIQLVDPTYTVMVRIEKSRVSNAVRTS
jgi:acetamidase/formamidase